MNKSFFLFLKKKNFVITNHKSNIKSNFFDKTKFFNNTKNLQLVFTNKIIFNSKNTFINDKLINLYFLFNYSLFNSNFGTNSTLKLFSIHNYNNKLILFDSSKFLLRWKELYDLIFNIFFYKFNPLVFSSIFFKNETLALNWNYNFFEINLWKYYFPFFIFKLNNYNRKASFFFEKIKNNNISFFFVTDCSYHYKNLYYLKKNNCYTVGLINVFLNPWLVSFPIITLFENFLVQLFFLKLIIFIQKNCLFLQYVFFKQKWTNYKINYKLR